MKQAKVLTDKELKKVIDYIDAFDKHALGVRVISLWLLFYNYLDILNFKTRRFSSSIFLKTCIGQTPTGLTLKNIFRIKKNITGSTKF